MFVFLACISRSFNDQVYCAQLSFSPNSLCFVLISLTFVSCLIVFFVFIVPCFFSEFGYEAFFCCQVLNGLVEFEFFDKVPTKYNRAIAQLSALLTVLF
jgi:hypothetical protein